MYTCLIEAYTEDRNGKYFLVVKSGPLSQEYPLLASSPMAASLEAKGILDKLIQFKAK